MFCKPCKENSLAKTFRFVVCHFEVFCLCCCVYVYLEGHVGNVDQLVVCEGEQVEKTQLGESSRLNFFHAVTVDHELLQ